MSARTVSSSRPGDDASPIEVRIIRSWLPFIKKNECCFLFVDKEGIAIEAFGSIRDKTCFDSKMQLQSCYRVNNYLSESHRRNYNIVPPQATVRLTRATTFTVLPDADLPFHCFYFLPFESLPNRLRSNFLLTDYIGRFEAITLDSITTSGRSLLKFILEDESDHLIEVAL